MNNRWRGTGIVFFGGGTFPKLIAQACAWCKGSGKEQATAP